MSSRLDMNRFAALSAGALTAFALLFSLHAHGQSPVVDYPFNPDSDGNQTIGSVDLTGFLATYGTPFEPASVMLDTLTLEAYLEGLQGQITSLQNALSTLETNASRTYALRLEYTASNHLVNDINAHSFLAEDGLHTAGASVTALSVNTDVAIYSVDLEFASEARPPVCVMVYAWDPMTYKYEVHPYRVDAGDFNLIVPAEQWTESDGQWESGLFSSTSLGISLNIDVRQQYIKYGNAVPFPPPSRLPHAFLTFAFE